MSADLRSKAGTATLVKVEFAADELSCLKNWINCHPDPKPDMEQAVRMIVRERFAKAI